MGIDEFRKTMLARTGRESLPAHLESKYGIGIEEMTELELGVYRVTRRDGPDWLARLFPAARTLESVEGDAEILRWLAELQFQSERCAHPDAVSVHEGQGVLVTDFVQGSRPKGSVRVFQLLGAVLGRLNTLPADGGAMARKGGAWHHLAFDGGLREEKVVVLSLLKDAERRIAAKQRGLLQSLCDEIEALDDFEQLPQAFIHPDLVPNNTIAKEGGGIVVDWAGAGRGPRIWPLGFLLWAASTRDRARVDAVAAGYRKHVELEGEESQRLSDAIRARPLVFDCWAFCMGRKELSEVTKSVSAARGIANAVAARAVQAFKSRNN